MSDIQLISNFFYVEQFAKNIPKRKSRLQTRFIV